jgi:hypothetical protein
MLTTSCNTQQENLLPLGAVVHLRGTEDHALMASYTIGAGAVVVDTITKEYPWGLYSQFGWSSSEIVAANLVRFAMNFVPGPPVVTVPANVAALEAVSAAGTAYVFTATSSDGSAVTCTPASGSTFALGPHRDLQRYQQCWHYYSELLCYCSGHNRASDHCAYIVYHTRG